MLYRRLFLCAGGCVEQTVSFLIQNDDINDENFQNLFRIQKNEFIDTSSLYVPRKARSITQNTESEYYELSDEAKDKLEEQAVKLRDIFLHDFE